MDDGRAERMFACRSKEIFYFLFFDNGLIGNSYELLFSFCSFLIIMYSLENEKYK